MFETMTDKQAAFIETLIAERDPNNADVRAIATMKKIGVLNKKNASTCIESLLSIPKAKVNTPVMHGHKVTAATSLSPGIYDTMPEKGDAFISGRFYIIYVNSHGSTSTKRLFSSWETKSGYSWKKVGSYYKPGTGKLKAMVAEGKAVLLSAEAAGALGKKFGMCMYCGLTLTDPESILNGIGPICAAKYGYTS